MSIRQHIVDTAQQYVGITEDAGRNVDSGGFIAGCWDHVNDDRYKIDGLGSRPGTDRIAGGDEWCAAFVSRVFAESGHPLVHNNGSGFYSCARIIEWLASLDQWHAESAPEAHEQYTPQAGDLVLFAWDKFILDVEDRGYDMTVREAMTHTRHVGIVVRYDQENQIVHTVEGNVGGVANKERTHEDGYLLGYGFPFA